MSLLGGISPLSLIATAALGPVGGIVAQLAQQVLSQVGQQFLQELGDQLNLPQSAIDMAQGAFTSSIGDFEGSAQNVDEAIEQLGRETGATPSDIGDAQRTMSDMIRKNAIEEAGGEDAKEAKRGGKGGSWLLAIAKALGAKADKLADKMDQQAAGLDTAKPSESAEFQATTQQFSMLMNAIGSSIKTLGEAMGNMARKQ